MHTLGCTFSSNYNKVSTCNLIYESYNVCLTGRAGQGGQTFSVTSRYLPGRYLVAPIRTRQGKAARQKDLGNFRIWFSEHGFQDLGSQLWDLGNFRIWFSGHGFQDLGSQLWGLGNFRIWFSRHGFQDLGFQLWGLDFHTRGFQDRNLKTFRT